MVGKQKKLKSIAQIYSKEKQFIKDVLGKLPGKSLSKLSTAPAPLPEPEPVEDECLIVNEKADCHPKKARSTEVANIDSNQEQMKTQKSRTTLNLEELQRRLQEKISLMSKERAEDGPSKKAIRRKQKKSQKEKIKAARKKKRISQSQNLISESSCDPKSMVEKTPLQIKPVVRTSTGKIVYSKFDFISPDNRCYSNPKQNSSTNQKLGLEKVVKQPAAGQIMKSMKQKSKKKLKRLEKQGKTKEAVTFVDTQKWNNTFQKEKGTKVRDDPTLLKKTIKKQARIKKEKQKKWQERTDDQEVQMKKRHTKRLGNIKARKEDKIKRVKKLKCKKGRTA